MYKALLLDLDDTLLSCSMETFIPVYFQALTRYVAHMIPADKLISALMEGIHAIEQSDGTGPTNEEKFLSIFYPSLQHDVEELSSVFEKFYAEEFPKLRHLTRVKPEARRLVEWAFERDIGVVIATNPIFPQAAIEQRLTWANIPVDEFSYALVTTMENMHAIKPHPAYYREIMERLDRSVDDCLMVGDDWERDIVPAASIGMDVYWIAEEGEKPPSDEVELVGKGNLALLWEMLR